MEFWDKLTSELKHCPIGSLPGGPDVDLVAVLVLFIVVLVSIFVIFVVILVFFAMIFVAVFMIGMVVVVCLFFSLLPDSYWGLMHCFGWVWSLGLICKPLFSSS